MQVYNRQVNQLYSLCLYHMHYKAFLMHFFCWIHCQSFIFWVSQERISSFQSVFFFFFNATVVSESSLRKTSWEETQKGIQPLLGDTGAFKGTSAFWVSLKWNRLIFSSKQNRSIEVLSQLGRASLIQYCLLSVMSKVFETRALGLSLKAWCLYKHTGVCYSTVD